LNDKVIVVEETTPQVETPPVAPAAVDTPPAEPSRAELWKEIEAAEQKAAEAPPVATEEAKPETKEQEKPDIWAGATPEQKALYEEAIQRARSNQGRIGALTRRINTLQAAASTAAPRETSKKARETIEALKPDYPEMARPLETMVDSLDARDQAQDKLLTDELAHAQAERKAIVDDEQAALSRIHPDWMEVLTKDDNRKKQFTDWVNDQPLAVRQAAARNLSEIVDAAEAAIVVGRFKQHLEALAPPAADSTLPPPPVRDTAPPAQVQPAAQPTQPPPSLSDRRQRQLEATSQPRGQGPAAVNGLPSADSNDRAAHWKAFEALDRQREAARR
jgi:hypothetical protein